MRIPARLFAVPVTVERYLGQGAYGDAYGDAVTVLGHVTGGQRVQSSGMADEVVTSQRLLLPNPARRADGPGSVDPVALLAPESKVTIAGKSVTVGEVIPHIKPGSAIAIYVSADLT